MTQLYEQMFISNKRRIKKRTETSVMASNASVTGRLEWMRVLNLRHMDLFHDSLFGLSRVCTSHK
jgi:hypothetical protein